MYERFWKRLIDIVLSAIGIVVTAIPMLIVSIIIKIGSKGPALFKQKRIGKDKELFTIYKFRSMPLTVNHDTPTHQFDAENELSRWQRFMRKTSIDELPQMFNIFKGDMSIVGPRPALWNQDDLIAERDKYDANSVKPGLTGWAQINGRDTLEIPEKARLDGVYTEKLKQGGFRAFAFDTRCFFGSIIAVFFKTDVVLEGGTGRKK